MSTLRRLLPGAVRRAWQAASTPKRAALITGGLALVVLSVGFHQATAQVQHGADFCTAGCHLDARLRPEPIGLHPNVECQKCHQSGLGLSLWAASVWSRLGVPTHGAVADANCGTCHNWVDDPTWRTTAGSPGHRVHENSGESTCLACHREELHQGIGVTSAVCLECHGDVALHQEDGHEVGRTQVCIGCHRFNGSPEQQRERIVAECVGCHASEQSRGSGEPATLAIEANALHAQARCDICHGLHGDTTAGSLRRQTCASCHQVDLGTEPPPEGHTACETCHPPHGAKTVATATCRECHPDDAQAGGAKAGLSTDHDSCGDCHRAHTWQTDEKLCGKCHQDAQQSVNAQGHDGHASCADCHASHTNETTQRRCATCHEAETRLHLASAGSHQDCSTCHDAHASTTVTCDTCHSAQARQVALAPGQHRLTCTQCHPPHGTSRGVGASCTGCHEGETSAAASAGVNEHQRCGSCHIGHAFAVGPKNARCTSCHQGVSAARTAHQGDCADCHSVHGPPAVAQARCEGCHENARQAGKGGHTKCSDCHQPHSAASGAARCESCHTEEAAVASAWKEGSAHRDACAACHDPHSGAPRASCQGCHETQAKAYGQTKHACADCHPPHESPRGASSRCQGCHQRETQAVGRTGGKHADCASCHATHQSGTASASCATCHPDEAKATARGKGDHGRCANCHRPHQFGSPTCQSCHGGTLPGAHVLAGHDDCRRCHTNHDQRAIRRGVCLSCHDAQRNHYPSTPTCQSCHPF
jgi:hypothetical protein